MYKYSDYINRDNPIDTIDKSKYSTIRREIFIYNLIRLAERYCTRDGEILGDEPLDDLSHIPMLTLDDLRRIRNNTYIRALDIAKSDAENGVRRSQYEILIDAFLDTPFGQNYKDAFANYLDSDRYKNDISMIESYSDVNTPVVPSDPFFAKTGVFDDRSMIGFIDGTVSDDTLVDRLNVVSSVGNPTILYTQDQYVAEKSNDYFQTHMIDDWMYRIGYYDIEHYVKGSYKEKEAVREYFSNYLKSGFDAYRVGDAYKLNSSVVDDQRKFMAELCDLFSSNGIDFKIVVNGSKLNLDLGHRRSITLFDTHDRRYQGRIYDNGRVSKFILGANDDSEESEENIEKLACITHEHRLNGIKWYFGLDRPAVTEDLIGHVKPANNNQRTLSVSNPLLIGEPKPVSARWVDAVTNQAGTKSYNPVIKNAGTGTISSRYLIGVINTNGRKRGESNKFEVNHDTINTVLLDVEDRMTSAYASKTITFMNSHAFNDYNMVYRSDEELETKSVSNGDRVWNAFIRSIPDDEMIEGDSKTGDIPKDHYGYYNARAARNTLVSLLDSAKENHRSRFNIDRLKADYEAFLEDENHMPELTADKDIDNLIMFYWGLLTTGDVNNGFNMKNMEFDSDDEEEAFDISESMNVTKEDIEAINNAVSVDDKISAVNTIYDRYVNSYFGSIPDIAIPGKSVPDNTGVRFSPSNIAKYMVTDTDEGQLRNISFIQHMCMRLGDEYSPDWIMETEYNDRQMKNRMVKFDENNVVASFGYSDIHELVYGRLDQTKVDKLFESDNGRALKDMPFTYDMLLNVIDSLKVNGCDPKSIRVSIDNKGVIKYEANEVGNKRFNVEKKDGRRVDAEYTPITGFIGQVFEPDEYGAIDPKYVVDSGKVMIPGYKLYLVDNDPSNPVRRRDRLRAIGYKQLMVRAISDEIRNALNMSDIEYRFEPHGASLNHVYKATTDTYITNFDREDYYESITPDNEGNFTSTQLLMHDKYRSLAYRGRFDNDFANNASTDANSKNEHPFESDSQRFDHYQSDKNDNYNIRVLDSEYDGIFCWLATGTAKSQGQVRYLVPGVIILSDGRVLPPSDWKEGDPAPVCYLLRNEIFNYKDHNSYDRLQMAFSQTMSAKGVVKANVVYAECAGFTFDDGMVVSRRFAESHPIRVKGDRNLGFRPLVMQDKMSDMHGNKGVISFVADGSYYSGAIYDRFVIGTEYDDGDVDVTLDNINYRIHFNEDDFNAWKDANADKINQNYDTDVLDYRRLYFAHLIQQQINYNYQPIYQERELSIAAHDDVLKLFYDNPDADVCMSPDSLQSRLNGGQIVEAYEHKKDLNLNGDKIKGMAEIWMIITDMIADVKNHVHDGDESLHAGKGRKIGVQESWALNCDGSSKNVNYFFKDNGSAYDNMREYAIALGNDFDEKIQPLVGYNPQVDRNEERMLFELMSDDQISMKYSSTKRRGFKYALDDATNAKVEAHILSLMNNYGGFMELPFPLNYNAISDKYKYKDGASDLSFKTPEIRKTHLENGVAHTSYALPVLSSGLRSSQEFQDGQIRVHEYTARYTNIYKNAVFYASAAREEERIKNDMLKAVADVNNDGSKSDKDKKTQIDKLNRTYETKKAELLRSKERFMSDAQRDLDFIQSDILSHRFDTKYNVAREDLGSKKIAQSGSVLQSADPSLGLNEISMSTDTAFSLGFIKESGYVYETWDIFDEKGRMLNRLYPGAWYRDKNGELSLNGIDPDSPTVIEDCMTILGFAKKYYDVNGSHFEICRSYVPMLESCGIIEPILDGKGNNLYDRDGNKQYAFIKDLTMNDIFDKIGITGDIVNNPVYKFDDSKGYLILRAPVIHKECMEAERSSNIKINNAVMGVSVNPMFSVRQDGDFDGDSLGLIPFNANECDLLKSFGFMYNFLNKNEVCEIPNPDNPDEVIKGHALYIQKGQDREVNMYLNPVLKHDFARLTYDINVFEANCSKVLRGDIADLPLNIKDYDGNPIEVDYNDQASVLKARIYFMNRINDMSPLMLKDVKNAFNFETLSTIADCIERTVEMGAKGKKSKIRDVANNIGFDYDEDKNGNIDHSTLRWIKDAEGHIISRSVSEGVKRKENENIERTAAYKADNTQLGGVWAQKFVATLRYVRAVQNSETQLSGCDIATRLAYPVTQGILQSKHDPKDASMKDEIVRYWGNSAIFSGNKLTGIWDYDEWAMTAVEAFVREKGVDGKSVLDHFNDLYIQESKGLDKEAKSDLMKQYKDDYSDIMELLYDDSKYDEYYNDPANRSVFSKYDKYKGLIDEFRSSVQDVASKSAFADYIRNTEHKPVTIPVADPCNPGGNIMVYDRDNKCNLSDFKGQPVEDRAYVKCSKEEWIKQVECFFLAMGIDNYNIDIIKDAAHMIGQTDSSVYKSAVTNRDMGYYDSNLKTIVPLKDTSIHINCLDDECKENASYLDSAIKTNRYNAIVDNSCNVNKPSRVTSMAGEYVDCIGELVNIDDNINGETVQLIHAKDNLRACKSKLGALIRFQREFDDVHGDEKEELKALRDANKHNDVGYKARADLNDYYSRRSDYVMDKLSQVYPDIRNDLTVDADSKLSESDAIKLSLKDYRDNLKSNVENIESAIHGLKDSYWNWVDTHVSPGNDIVPDSVIRQLKVDYCRANGREYCTVNKKGELVPVKSKPVGRNDCLIKDTSALPKGVSIVRFKSDKRLDLDTGVDYNNNERGNIGIDIVDDVSRNDDGIGISA